MLGGDVLGFTERGASKYAVAKFPYNGIFIQLLNSPLVIKKCRKNITTWHSVS